MRILVAGSRDFTDWQLLEMILDDLMPFPRMGDTVVQGFARGADRMAYEWAEAKDVSTESHIPKWREHGKAAGFIRNKGMVDKGADLCLIFYGPHGETKGTKSTEDLARKAGIPVRVYFQEERS